MRRFSSLDADLEFELGLNCIWKLSNIPFNSVLAVL